MTTTVPTRPRWLVRCAWAAFLVTVPSALWRVLMIVGLVPGTAAMRTFELGDTPVAGYAYVVGLSVVQVSTAALVVGLVRPWGERFRGRRVPAVPVVVAGLLGGGVVTAIFDVAMVTALLQGHRPDGGTVHGGALAVMIACYLPIFLWGPLTLAATAGYARRRLGRRVAPVGVGHHRSHPVRLGGQAQAAPGTSTRSVRTTPSDAPSGP